MLFSSVTKTYNYFWKNLDHMELGRFLCLKNCLTPFPLFLSLLTKPWQFLLVSFVKGHLSPQVHEWCVKALLLCEQTRERRVCPHGPCQGGQVLTQSLILKPAQLKSQHSPALRSEGGSAHLWLLCGDDFLPSCLQTFVTPPGHILANSLHPLSCPGPWSAIRDLRKWEYDKGWVEVWCVLDQTDTLVMSN